MRHHNTLTWPQNDGNLVLFPTNSILNIFGGENPRTPYRRWPLVSRAPFSKILYLSQKRHRGINESSPENNTVNPDRFETRLLDLKTLNYIAQCKIIPTKLVLCTDDQVTTLYVIFASVPFTNH